jgi:hypothetical protein
VISVSERKCITRDDHRPETAAPPVKPDCLPEGCAPCRALFPSPAEVSIPTLVEPSPTRPVAASPTRIAVPGQSDRTSPQSAPRSLARGSREPLRLVAESLLSILATSDIQWKSPEPMNRCPAASGGPRLSRYGSLTSLTGRLESTQERTFLDGMPNGQIDLSGHSRRCIYDQRI